VVEVFPAPSLAVNVLVWLRAQVELKTPPSLAVTVVAPQLSVAEAEPSAALISDADGLQPNVNAVPVAVIVGGVLSLIVI
jgi:hypothetical protein